MPPRLLPAFLYETGKAKTKAGAAKTSATKTATTTKAAGAGAVKKRETHNEEGRGESNKERNRGATHQPEKANHVDDSINRKRKAQADLHEDDVDVDNMELDQEEDYSNTRKMQKYSPNHGTNARHQKQNDVVMHPSTSTHSSPSLYEATARANPNLFLGIYIYFGTGNVHIQDEMATAVLSLAGQVTNDLSSCTTHYISDVPLSSNEANTIASAYPQLVVVNSKWLIESVSTNELLDEFKYS